MHDNSMNLMREFVEKYNIRFGTVVDVGSQDLNGNYRGLFAGMEYIGVDIVEGKNVDVIMDSEQWQAIKGVDVVICGQTLEHVADIPKLLSSIFNVLKPGGLLCMIAPSAGPPHDYPIWVGHFSREKMAQIIEDAGFETIDCIVSPSEPFRDVRCIARKVIKETKRANRITKA